MRIGIDIRPTQLVHGARGIGSYVYTLVQGLAEAAPDNEYVLIAFPDRPLPEALAGLPPCCRVAHLPTRLLGGGRWHQAGRAAWHAYHLYRRVEHRQALLRLVRRERLDVLHLTHGVERQFYAGGTYGCRVVRTLYDLTPLVLKGEFLDAWPEDERAVFRRQLGAIPQADVVVAISESARQDAITLLGTPEAQIVSVPPGVSGRFAAPPEEAQRLACRRRYDIAGPYFLFCSGLGLNKNVERVVAAFQRFAGHHAGPSRLVIVGPGHEAGAGLMEVVAGVGLDADRVRVLGHIPEDDLICLFADAVALVTPSLYEGFGLPAVQAMLAGTPVIASDRASYPEVVGEAGLLVDPYQVAEIAQAMSRIASDPCLGRELSRCGREQARRFDPARQAEAMLRVYTQGTHA